MISLSGSKNQELIWQIQEHEEAPRTLENLFSQKEIQIIKTVADKSYESLEFTQKKLISDSGKALGNVAHPQGEEAQFLEQLVRKKIEPFTKFEYRIAFSFHRNYFPYGTHTDSGYDANEWIYKQGIIPLEVDPPDQEVYTVIFEQKAYHSISFPGRVETIRALKPSELEVVHGYDTSQTLSDLELSKLFQGPQDRERFRGFKVLLPFRWRVGDMALWDRAHLHCSSDFQNHGVRGKLGLMWISWRV